VSCPPPDDPRLLDWWRGDLPEAESEAFEEHLFACERCRHAAGELAAIEGGVREIVRKGGLGFVPSTSVLERMRRDGVRMRAYRVSPGETVACTVAAEDDLVVTTLLADLAGVDAVDVSLTSDGVAMHLAGVPVEPGRGAVVFASAADAIRRLPRCVLHVRLTTADARVLGEYTLDHTPPAA
jgi:anti-sigma factor RsiW